MACTWLRFSTLVTFLKTSEFQWIVLAGWANVVDEQVVVGDLVAVLGVVPEPTYILDQLTVVIDQHVVDGDDAFVAIPSSSVALQDFQTSLVQRLLIPDHVVEELVQTRLVGRVGKFAVDGRDVFLARNEQAGDVFGKVSSLRFARKYISEVRQRFEHDLRELDDRGQGHFLHQLCAPSNTNTIKEDNSHFLNAA